MPTWTTSSPPSWRGNSYGAIPITSATIAQLRVTLPARSSFPNRSSCAGGYPFPIDPDLRADRAPIVWLPHLDLGTIIIAPAPEGFADARNLGGIPPSFERRAAHADYWLIAEPHGRLPVVFIGGAGPATPAAVIIPLDADFATRAAAALRLWRVVTGRPHGRPPEWLTRQRRLRLRLTLRALDGRLAGESYRVMAQSLFGRARIPAGVAWKTHELRDRTIRLARSGLELMRGGYLALLRYRRPKRG